MRSLRRSRSFPRPYRDAGDQAAEMLAEASGEVPGRAALAAYLDANPLASAIDELEAKSRTLMVAIEAAASTLAALTDQRDAARSALRALQHELIDQRVRNASSLPQVQLASIAAVPAGPASRSPRAVAMVVGAATLPAVMVACAGCQLDGDQTLDCVTRTLHHQARDRLGPIHLHPMPAVGLSAWQVRPVRWAFFFLAVATLASLNGASNMMFDTGWHVTLSLAFCSAYLCAVVRVPFAQCLGSPGLLILATLAAYLWIGGAVVALTDGASLQGNMVVLRVVLSAVLIVGDGAWRCGRLAAHGCGPIAVVHTLHPSGSLHSHADDALSG